MLVLVVFTAFVRVAVVIGIQEHYSESGARCGGVWWLIWW